MLIEFKVANFRSIRDQQSLSLVAAKTDTQLPQNVIETKLPGLSSLRYLKGAALYGANASGKSNVLEALFFLANMVATSATRLEPGTHTGTQPFKLEAAFLDAPTQFEITFTAQEVRYVYGVSLSRQRILLEYLDAYPKGLPQHWYRRTYDADTREYSWTRSETFFRFGSDLQEKTRDNVLFLSVAAFFNSEQLTPVFEWFRWSLRFLAMEADAASDPLATLFQYGKPGMKERIVALLNKADTGIVAMRFNPREMSTSSEEAKQLMTGYLIENKSPEGEIISLKALDIEFGHSTGGSAFVPLDFPAEESAGTRRYFSLIGPWIDILENGYTIFIDEIDTSMHPLLVRELLKLVFSDRYNAKGAQVIFTTHNPVLLDTTLLRRDQIWFTEKTLDGATHLYPLTDYKPRRDEAIARGYLAGRYGGIPFIPEGLPL